eukprot:s4461_g2.t1
MALILAFANLFTDWMEGDVAKRQDYIARVEVLADCLARIVKQMGLSCLNEHLTVLWVMTRRMLCVCRGLQLEQTEAIRAESIGGLPAYMKGFLSLTLIPVEVLLPEIVQTEDVLQEWMLLARYDSELEDILELVWSTLQDIRAIINAPGRSNR